MANNHDAPPTTADKIPVEELIASDLVRKARQMIERTLAPQKMEHYPFLELVEAICAEYLSERIKSRDSNA